MSVLFTTPLARAGGLPVYWDFTNTNQTCQGYGQFTYQYTNTLTSPTNGVTYPSGGYTVNLSVNCATPPSGSTTAVANTYVTLSPNTLTFTGASQAQTFTVYVNIPSGAANGTFIYNIIAANAATGAALSSKNSPAAQINATESPLPLDTPVIVQIASPVNGTSYNPPAGSTLSVPIIVGATASAAFPVSTLSATITGFTVDATQTPAAVTTFLPAAVINLNISGLGTASESGEMLGGFSPLKDANGNYINATYTVTATATNSGFVNPVYTDTIANSFTVGTGPKVVITSPTATPSIPLSVASSSPGVTMGFTGTSQAVGAVITALTLQLDNGTVTPLTTLQTTALNTPQAFGTVTTPITTPGTHTFTVTATDMYGTATTTGTFSVIDNSSATVSGVVFADANANGLLDTGELGVANVSVTLTNTSTGAATATATTDTSGNYNFASVPAGNYMVTVDPLGLLTGLGYSLTTGNVPQAVIVAVGAASATTPTGFTLPGSVSGSVYKDNNGNGSYEATGGDALFGGLTVTLANTATGASFVTTTSVSGTYRFAAVPAGSYTVTVTTPTGYTLTTNNNPSAVVTLTGNGAAATVTAIGFAPSSSVSGVVFSDNDLSGNYGGNDTFLANVTVNLKNTRTNATATAVTDGSGGYTFTTIYAGTYTVTVDTTTLPAGYNTTPTTTNPGTTTWNNPQTVIVGTGATGPTAIGFAQPNTLGGLVFLDSNWNTAYDGLAIDGVISNVTVTLNSSAGVAVASTTTGTNGYYLFTSVPIGNYTVIVSSPGTSYVLTTPNNLPVQITAAYGTVTTVNPIGFATNAASSGIGSISGFVFNDVNGDGINTAGTDTPLSGVSVTLTNTDNNTTPAQIVVTNSTGINYSFTGLLYGHYTVTVATPSGYKLTTKTNGGSVFLTSLNNATASLPDTGFMPPPKPTTVALTGSVFYDANSNGTKDASETTALGGVPVQLVSSTGASVTVNTGTNGSYTFNVAPGGYTVNFAGTFGAYRLTTSASYVITLTATAVTVPATGYGPSGCTKGATVVGSVYFDLNCNGIRNTEDYGLGCVTVQLLKANNGGSCGSGSGWGFWGGWGGFGSISYTTVATTTTAANGTYTFQNVASGSYMVSVCDPNGFTPSTSNDWNITVSGPNCTVPDTGYSLDFCAIRTKCAGGQNVTCWKGNVDRAIANKCKKTDVDATTLKCETNQIGSCKTSPFCGIDLPHASSTLGCTSSAPADQLKQQLAACEYNKANGNYIDNDQRLTNAFCAWGENVAKNSQCYPSSYVVWAKNWCSAYNNSNGGWVWGPYY